MQHAYHRCREAVIGIHLYATGKLHQLYHWVLSWANSKHGTLALFGISFAESSFFPIPPDILQIALSVSKPERSFLYALISTIASVLGGIAGYIIGLILFDTIGKMIITTLGYQHYFAMVGKLYADNAFWAVLGAAFTPIPYKVFTIAAGVWKVTFFTFLIASVIGRAGRFFIVAGMLYFFGSEIKVFIDRYFNLLSILLFIVVIAGFVAIRYIPYS